MYKNLRDATRGKNRVSKIVGKIEQIAARAPFTAMPVRLVKVHVALQTLQLRLVGSRLLLTLHDGTERSAVLEGGLETLENICDGMRGHSAGGLSIAVACACVSGLMAAVEGAAERQAEEIRRVSSKSPSPMTITVSFFNESNELLPSLYGPCMSALHAAAMALLALCDPQQLLGAGQLMRGLQRFCDPEDGSVSLGLACAAARLALGFALSVARFTAASFDCRSELAYHYAVMPGMNGVLAVMGGATACLVMQRLMISRLYCANDLIFFATATLSSAELSGLAASRDAVAGLVPENLCELVYLVCDLAFALCTGVPPLQGRDDMQTAMMPWIESHTDQPAASMLTTLPEDVLHQWLVGLVDRGALLARAAAGVTQKPVNSAHTAPSNHAKTDRFCRAQTPAPKNSRVCTDDDSSSDDETVVLRDAADSRKRTCDTASEERQAKRPCVATTTIVVSRPRTLLGIERSSVTIPATRADTASPDASAEKSDAAAESAEKQLLLDALKQRHRQRSKPSNNATGSTPVAAAMPQSEVHWRVPLHDTFYITSTDK